MLLFLCIILFIIGFSFIKLYQSPDSCEQLADRLILAILLFLLSLVPPILYIQGYAGVDVVHNYLPIFDNLDPATFFTNLPNPIAKDWYSGYAVENGFMYVVAFFKLFSPDYVLFLWFIQLIFITFYYKLVRHSVTLPFLALLVYMIFFAQYNNNVIRQMLSMVIAYYAVFSCFLKGKHLKFILWLLVAFSIHNAAITILFVYFYSVIKSNKKLIYIVLFAILFFTLDHILNMTSYLQPLVVLSGISKSYQAMDVKGTNIIFFFYALTTLAFLYLFDRFQEYGRVMYMYRFILVIAVLIYSLFGNFGLFPRLSVFLFYPIIFVIPLICYKLSKPIILVFYTLAMLLLINGRIPILY